MSTPDSGRREVDRAALLGAALAAVVALTFGGQGPWEWLAAASGIALLAVLVAFFRLPTDARSSRSAAAELVAVSAVAALAATLVIATPMQMVIEVATPMGRTCAGSAAVAAAVVASDQERLRAADLAVARLAREGVPASSEEVIAQAASDADRTVRGECLGAATTQWLWIPAIGLTLVIFVVATLRMRWRRSPA